MYAFIKGIVEYKDEGSLAVDSCGIGFEVRVTEPVFMDTNVGDNVMLYTVHVVNTGDGTQVLYGLPSLEEKKMFLKLTSVTRVGGKAALAILSRLSVQEIVAAVAAQDAKVFSKVGGGVGLKAAERIILELKGKLNGFGITQSKARELIEELDVKQEAIDALTGIGFNLIDAKEAVEAVSVLADSAEELVTLAIKRLGM